MQKPQGYDANLLQLTIQAEAIHMAAHNFESQACLTRRGLVRGEGKPPGDRNACLHVCGA